MNLIYIWILFRIFAKAYSSLTDKSHYKNLQSKRQQVIIVIITNITRSV